MWYFNKEGSDQYPVPAGRWQKGKSEENQKPQKYCHYIISKEINHIIHEHVMNVFSYCGHMFGNKTLLFRYELVYPILLYSVA